MDTRLKKIALAIVATVMFCALGSIRASQACDPPVAGPTAGIQEYLNSKNSAILCANQTYYINDQIQITANNQTIDTEGGGWGLPRAILRYQKPRTSGDCEWGGVVKDRGAHSGVRIANLVIYGHPDGPQLPPTSCGYWSVYPAVLELGGQNVNGVNVENLEIYEPNGWSAIHLYEGSVDSWGRPSCRMGWVVNNQIFGSGQHHLGDHRGLWADGISMACAGDVSFNTVVDATDVGIMVFASGPGASVSVHNNRIFTNTRNLFSAIGLGSIGLSTRFQDATVGGTSSGQWNQIVASGSARIDHGIGIGARVGGCGSETLDASGTIIGHNYIQGNVSYGIPLNGVANLTVVGNTADIASGYWFGLGCGTVPPPGFPFQWVPSTCPGTSVQSGYLTVPSTLQHLTWTHRLH